MEQHRPLRASGASDYNASRDRTSAKYPQLKRAVPLMVAFLTVNARNLSMVNKEGARLVAAGDYTLFVLRSREPARPESNCRWEFKAHKSWPGERYP